MPIDRNFEEIEGEVMPSETGVNEPTDASGKKLSDVEADRAAKRDKVWKSESGVNNSLFDGEIPEGEEALSEVQRLAARAAKRALNAEVDSGRVVRGVDIPSSDVQADLGGGINTYYAAGSLPKTSQQGRPTTRRRGPGYRTAQQRNARQAEADMRRRLGGRTD